jgi:uncharacterized NAD(P)/FAD-binding protein YdhS
MDVIVISSDAYKMLVAEIRKTVRETVHEVAHPKSDWLDEKEAMDLLGIKSKTTLQNLRDSQEFKFSKHGRIIRYSNKSILEFLERNSKH